MLMKSRRRPHIVIFTSSSTAKNFAELVGEARDGIQNNVQFASIGPVTSATLRELQMPVAIEAREFTMGGLIRAIVLARYAQTTVQC
jgi:uroporphyrinogen-III synthase